MAKNNEAKVKFTAETADFNKSIKRANAELGVLSSELTLNATKMKSTGETAEGLTERQELLTEQLKAAGDKTEALRKKMAVAEKYYGSNSDEVLQLKKQVTAAATAEEKIKQQISACNDKLEDQERQADDTGDAVDKLEDVTKDAGDAAEKASDGFTVWKGTLSNLISSGIQNAISGIGDLMSSLWGLADETRETRTNMAKLDTAFSTAGFGAETASDTYKDLYGILGDEGQATEAASHLSLLATSEEELAAWTDICTGVYATFGDSLPIEGLAEAANETAKVGQVTGPLADALNWSTMSAEDWEKALGGNSKALKAFQKATKRGMSAEDAFNEALAACSTEQERQQLIMGAMNGLYGEAGAAYAEANADLIEANEAQAEYNETLAGLGAFIEPLKTAFTTGMTAILDSVLLMLQGIDMEALKQTMQDVFSYITDTIFPAIQTGIQWFIDNKDLIIAGLAAILAGIVAFKVVTIIQSAVSAFQAWKAATEGMTIAQRALNLVMHMNPIALVIAAVVALVAAFIYLWNNCESFRQFWINLWNNVTAWCSSAWQSICAFFSNAWVWIQSAWAGAGEWFGGIWQSIKDFFAGVPEWFSEKFNAAWTFIQTAFSSIGTWFSERWADVRNAFAAVGSWFGTKFTLAWTNIKNAFASVKEWFSQKWSDIQSVFSGVAAWFQIKFNQAWAKIKAVFSGWGEFFSGLWTSIKEKFSDIGANLGSAISDTVKSGINAVLGWVETTLNSAIGLINGAIAIVNKVPGVDLSLIPDVDLPELATGGVLRTETAFVGGEYPGANRNPEIVTPQSIMRETFADTLSAFLPSTNSLYMDDLVGAIEDLASRAIQLYIGDRQVALATAGASDRVSGNRLKLKERGLAL